MNKVLTLKASGRTSAITIQIMHPAAKPVQKGSTFWNESAQRNAGTATIGWIHQGNIAGLGHKQRMSQLKM
jgi:hypothetical protein